MTDSGRLYFRWLAQLFDRLTALRVKSKGGKQRLLATFRRTFLPPRPSPDLLFDCYRLLLPDVRRRSAVAAQGRLSCHRRRLSALSPTRPRSLCTLQLDKSRQVYGLKEAALADVVAEAMGALKASRRCGGASEAL